MARRFKRERMKTMNTMTTRKAILLRMTDLEVIQLTIEHIM